MKKYKLLQLLVLCCLVFACTKDTFEEQKADQLDPRLVQDQYDNSYLGVYKGLFTTNDGLTRGSLVIELTPDNIGIAHLNLSSGQVLELRSGKPKLTVDGNVGSLRFSSEGLGALTVAMNFSVEADGANPSITNVVFDNKESDILIAKNLSRAPLTPITGTYVRTAQAGPGGFPNSNRTWNMMSIGEGDQNFAVQITYGNRTYQIPAGNSSQSGCVDGGELTTCNIAGTASFLGHNITWIGTHTYATANNETCSAVSGTWSAPTFNGSSGTFVSDSDCSNTTVANDTCTTATVINVGESLSGSSANSTDSDTPDFCADNLFGGIGSAGTLGVWFSITPTEDQVLTVDTDGSTGMNDTQLRVFSGTCDNLVCVGSDDDGGEGLLSLVSFSATANETYFVFLAGYDNQTGAYTINVSGVEIVEGDFCVSAFPIECGGSVSGTTVGATNSDNPGGCVTDLSTAPGVWYSFTADSDLTITADTFGSSFDTKLGIFVGNCDDLICVGGNDDAGDGAQSEVNDVLIFNGETVYIYVTGFNTNAGDYVLNLVCEEPEVFGCGDTLVDDGGVDGNYSVDQLVFYNIDAGAGNIATINFSTFDMEFGWDEMYFFDGATTGADLILLSDNGASPSIGDNNVSFTGTDLEGDSISSTGQYMTVAFLSDDICCVGPGFEGVISCSSGRAAVNKSSVTRNSGREDSVIMSKSKRERRVAQKPRG